MRAALPGVDRQAWFTHHDIAFDGGYPGAVPPFAVEGCDVLINGHIHKTQKAIMAGRTRWLNPGNITRQSVDLRGPRSACLDPWMRAVSWRLRICLRDATSSI